MTPESLPQLLRAHSGDGDDGVLEAVMHWAAGLGLTLYPHQEEALVELVAGANVVLATPTGSGKSLVATAAHAVGLARGVRSYYSAPIKALVSEKFFALCEVFGADLVGMATGDASINPGAPIICCTAEVLANQALRDGADADVGIVVMDEFHYYADPQRGWAWQVPLLTLPRAQFVLMSATLGEVTALREDLTRRNGRPTALVTTVERPVPLTFHYATTPVHETIAELVETKQAPVYVVHSTQAAALERAQALTSTAFATRSQRDAIAARIARFRFAAGFGATLSRLLRHGVGVHHAGMLPRYRRLVEQLATEGLLPVICGTDTLGVGINVPIRTVLLTGLTKFDGQRVRQLSAREFHQIAGRAGRAGFDTAGTVVVQAPDHEIENARRVAKAGDDPVKLKRVVRTKAPDGFVSWGRPSFEKLVAAQPEQLTSRMQVNHAMVLDVLARPDDGVAALRRLLEDNHEPRAVQLRLLRRAIVIGRALLAAGVVERLAEPDGFGRRVRLTMDLPPNFGLDQPLSLFALAAIDVLDPESDTYALDVISVIEATLQDPRPVLQAQRSKARGEAVAQMKADGLEYEERMELLEEVTHPRPLAELLEATVAIYRQSQPWVDDYELAPKSVVREMVERAMSFREFVAHYSLARSEGVLLRYLADAYRALRKTVPAAARTPELEDLVVWLAELVRQTDSSLVQEWSALIDGLDDGWPVALTPPTGGSGDGPPPLSANPRALRVMVRNAMFRRVDLAARQRWDELGELDGEAGWDAQEWQDALADYFAVHDRIETSATARSAALFVVRENESAPVEDGGRHWAVRQVLDDPAGDHDWGIEAVVDLDATDDSGDVVLRIVGVGELTLW